MIRLPNIAPRRARRLSVWLAAALSIIFLYSNAAYAQDDFLAPDDQHY